jgi:hypothetical protein
MSYEIIYDKQFVKVNENTFIPMILAGSNNCYEWSPSGKERRARSWWNFSYLLGGKLAGSLEEMLKIQENYREGLLERHGEEYDDNSFGYYSSLSINGGGCNATYGQYTGVSKTGCAKALTVEQLANEYVHLHISTSRYGDTEEKLKEVGLEPLSFTPKSTQELEDFIENIAPKYAEATILQATFHGMSESKPKWIRKKYFPPKPKAEKVVVNSPYGYAVKIIKDERTFGYLYKYKGGTFRYGHGETSGRQFLIKKKAEQWAKNISKRRSDFSFEVVLVEYSIARGFSLTQKEADGLILPTPEPMSDKELIASLDIREKGEERVNLFDPTKGCFLEPLGVALHDFIKGCEVMRTKQHLMSQAIDIFREKYPEEYYVLLD